MTRTNLRQRILENLNESASSPVHFSTTQIDSSIEEAFEILAEEVEGVKRTVFVPLREGTTYYHTISLANDMMIPYRLWTPDNNKRLHVTSLPELAEFSDTWTATSGPPESWFPISWDIFGIYPRPATGGGILRIDYLAWPRALLDDDDESELPEASQLSAIDYCVYDGLIKRYDVITAIDFLNRFAENFSSSKARSGIKRIGGRTFWKPRKPHTYFPSEIGDRSASETYGV